MSRRRIRPEELELWHQVARSAQRLPGRPNRDENRSPGPKTKPVTQAQTAPLPSFEIGQASGRHSETLAAPMSVGDRLAQAPLQMDAKSFGKLKRGKLLPEARIDLHGMTLDQAHPELNRFILGAQLRGLRLVLVITGKGQREDPYQVMPMRRGVLKQQVPQWLRMAPLSSAVLQISEAHQRHGGAGAYYVYLRRRR